MAIIIFCYIFAFGTLIAVNYKTKPKTNKYNTDDKCALHNITNIFLMDGNANENNFSDTNTANISAFFSIEDEILTINVLGARGGYKGRYLIHNTISYEISDNKIEINVRCPNSISIAVAYIAISSSKNPSKSLSNLTNVIQNYNHMISEKKDFVKMDLAIYYEAFTSEIRDLFKSFISKYQYIYTNLTYLGCIECYVWDQIPLLGEDTIINKKGDWIFYCYKDVSIVMSHINNELDLFIKLICQKLNLSNVSIPLIEFAVVQRLILDAMFMMSIELTTYCKNDDLNIFANSIHDEQRFKIFIEHFFENGLKINDKEYLILLLISYLVNKNFITTHDIFNYHKKISDIVDAYAETSKLKSFESLLTVNTNNYQIDINDIDAMNGYAFEDLVAQIFKKNGYLIKQTSYSGDQGVDVIAQKNDEFIAIQVKRYSSKVDNSAIQQVVAGAIHYGCNKKMVITNNFFTTSAQNLAITNQVTLWDRTKLIEMLHQFNFS